MRKRGTLWKLDRAVYPALFYENWTGKGQSRTKSLRGKAIGSFLKLYYNVWEYKTGEVFIVSMHKVEYTIHLTGSKLFDMVMYNTATKLCQDYPGLQFEYGTTEIRVYGELEDFWYEKYQEAMFGEKKQ